MQKHTKSILDELNDLYIVRDKNHVIETRGRNVIQSAIHLFEQIEKLYNSEDSEDLQRKFVNAIRARDIHKFSRSLRKKDED